MLKRALLLCLGLWLMAAAGLSAHAGPCDMGMEKVAVAAPAEAHAHCDMMAAPDAAPPAMPDAPDSDGNCCCPAIVSALPAPAAPDASEQTFTLMADFPPDARAASRTLIPEPPPPKA
jgi:hypothetical protein